MSLTNVEIIDQEHPNLFDLSRVDNLSKDENLISAFNESYKRYNYHSHLGSKGGHTRRAGAKRQQE